RSSQSDSFAEHDLLLKNHQSSLLDLQRYVGDIAGRLDERPQGKFYGTTQPNLVDQLKEITTRSGRVLGLEVNKERVEVEDEKVFDEEIEMEVLGKIQGNAPIIEPQVEKKPVEVWPSHIIDHAHILYPMEYKHFLNIFRQLKINIPFIEALQHMPKCAKFLKDLLKRKYRLGEVSSIPPNEVSSIQLELGKLTPTRMSFSLPDRSVKYPRGIIENLLVKVDKFVFPVDFVVLDMEADERVPIILGRSFLRMENGLTDVYNGMITLRVGDGNVTYDVARSMKHPSDHDDFIDPCHSVYFLNYFIPGFDTYLSHYVHPLK
ncbi:uncharacterized protein LOC143613700, partial [Bidens hawaiensis]|uniref:uncharacterized protein LOC143613700 n=1 Tax=Bidens hawaiensis TaxID=980011 RepID=UPI00404B67BB